MKRNVAAMAGLMIAGLFAVLALNLTYAQGRASGQGNGPQGTGCPYGYNQPNSDAGGWWTRVTPATPEQRAFVEAVTRLHNLIREAQFALQQLEESNTDPTLIEAKRAEIDALRTQLHDLQFNNRERMQQLRSRGGFGRGNGQELGHGRGQRQGNGCPFGGQGRCRQ